MRLQPKTTTATTAFMETKTKIPNNIYSKCGRLQQALQIQEKMWYVTKSHGPYTDTPITH